MTSLFVSYSRKDSPFAHKLIDAFKGQDWEFWIDWEDIPPTVEWWKEIEKGIEESGVFLFLISPDSVRSKYCWQEVEHAARNGKRLIPIVVREVNAEDVPPELCKLNWIFIRENDDFQAACEKLFLAVRTDYDWVKAHRQLQFKALEWERNNHDKSLLLRGTELQVAEFQLKTNSSKDPHPTDLQRGYVHISRQGADKQRRLITGLAIGIVIALTTLGAFGWYQAIRATKNEQRALTQEAFAQEQSIKAANNAATAEANAQEAERQRNTAIAAQAIAEANAQEAARQEKIARIGELAAQSIAMQQKDSKISILLAIESFRLGGTVQSRGALLVAAKADTALQKYCVGHSKPVLSVAFHPDGKIFASGSEDDTIILWDVETCQPISQPLSAHKGNVFSVAFSPDGKMLASGSEDQTIILWDVEDPQKPQPIGVPLSGHFGEVSSIAFSPDGKMLASGGGDLTKKNNVLFLWNVEKPQSPQPIGQPFDDSEWVWSVAFSPDGKILASASNDEYDYTIRLWDVETRQLIGEPLRGHKKFVNSVTFSPDGNTLFSGSWDENLFQWDLETDPPKGQPLPGYSNSIQSVAFNPDGKTLALGTVDNAILLWDMETRQPIGHPLNGHSRSVRSVAFSPDGKTLVSGSDDHTIILWDLNPQSWLEKACQHAGHNFTRAEWTLYFPNDPYPVEKEDATCPQWPLEPEVTPAP